VCLDRPRASHPFRSRSCPAANHQPPGPVHDRVAALQRQGAHDTIRAAGLARARLPGDHPALREKITPNTLTRAYQDAGYFERNACTIEVLIDRDAVTAGQAAAGEAWQHYDLGHGLCSYTFFEQCQHRMACAKCDFYIPKESSRAQLLETKANLQRRLVAIPLTDDERAAIGDGQAALGKLLERLADIPTPAGPTPNQLSRPEGVTLLPVIDPTSTRTMPDRT
jgi:hypothetical protein